MAFVNKEGREIHCKVVYYGPSLGGKTTNVQWLYGATSGGDTSKLIAFHANPERTVFFDFLPLGAGEIRGLATRFHIYTVPGQVVYDASRKLILTGLDAVIFVADSQQERMEENIESIRNLETSLTAQGYDLRRIPFAIQYNKRDLPSALPVAELRATLNRWGVPDYEAVASKGTGVMETFNGVSRQLVATLKSGAV